MFLLFLCCGIVGRVLVLGLFCMSDTIRELNPSGPELFVAGRLFMAAFSSLRVIGPFRLFIWSWFNFGSCYVSRKLPMSPDFPILFSISFCIRIWWVVFVSWDYVVMSPFSFLILLIWIQFLCPLVRLAKGLSILLIFSKNHPLVL